MRTDWNSSPNRFKQHKAAAARASPFHAGRMNTNKNRMPWEEMVAPSFVLSLSPFPSAFNSPFSRRSSVFFFPPNLPFCSNSGDQPQEGLAKSDYMRCFPSSIFVSLQQAYFINLLIYYYYFYYNIWLAHHSKKWNYGRLPKVEG